MKNLKFLFAFIALSQITSSFAFDVEIDGICYNLLKNNEAEVTFRISNIGHSPGSRKPDYDYVGKVVIPSSFDYLGDIYTVVKIGHEAFDGCWDLTDVELPNTITEIAYSAFYGCKNLSTINIPERVSSIGLAAFCTCINLKSITIPQNVKSIDGGAFWGCEKLEVISLPDTLTFLGGIAFEGTAWYNNQPDGPIYAGAWLSQYKGFMSEDTRIVIKPGTKGISEGVFKRQNHNTTPVSISIPESVLYIGAQAFKDCERLKEIIIPNNTEYIGSSAFEGCSSLEKIVLPNKLTAINNLTFSNCTSLSSIELPDSVKVIGARAFQYCESLESITIPNSVTDIQGTSFLKCKKLTSIIISENITRIEDDTFMGCMNLSTIVIPEGVTSIGARTFYNCTNLQSVTLPSSLSEIGFLAFTACTSMTDFYSTAINPPTAAEGFSDTDLSQTTLHVPYSALERYQTTAPWNRFGQFKPWPQTSYTITYIIDGKTYKSVEYEIGSSVIPEAAPEKEGYTFSGWTEIPETMPEHDVTVTGSFSINSYTLIYMVDGQEYKRSTVQFDSRITAEEAPTKDGYTFSGWSEIPSTMPTHDVIVTGTFTVNSYSLTYLVDGETYKTSTVEYGTVLTAEENPIREGYTFSGWSEIPATMPAKDVTVTGTFTINSYKLTYMVDGVEYKSFVIKYGEVISPETEPQKEGYSFSGWSEVPSTMPAHDVTVTGAFSKGEYQVTYMVDGEVYKTVRYDYEAAVTAEEVPEKEGYTFSGWSEVPETMPAHDVTVTGSFAINSYTIIYMVDGEEYKRASVEYGTELMAEENPEKEGYTFSGWSEVPATMPAHDVTVTGTFVINQYSITYMYEGEVFQTVTLDYQAEVEAPAFPLVVEGYTFVWDGLPERMPAHDVIVTGVFQVNQYCITYVVDGEVVDTQLVDYGSEITPPAVADKEGYTFGWDAYPPTMPAHDLTITGSYLTGIRSLRGGLAVQQIYTVDGKRVTKVGRGVHLVRQGKQIIKIVK